MSQPKHHRIARHFFFKKKKHFLLMKSTRYTRPEQIQARTRRMLNITVAATGIDWHFDREVRHIYFYNRHELKRDGS